MSEIITPDSVRFMFRWGYWENEQWFALCEETDDTCTIKLIPKGTGCDIAKFDYNRYQLSPSEIAETAAKELQRVVDLFGNELAQKIDAINSLEQLNDLLREQQEQF